jgi:hypothetical protein
VLTHILHHNTLSGGFPMSKPFDPREQPVREPLDESVRRAKVDAQRERDAFTRATGIPVDERGFLQLPDPTDAERRRQLQQVTAMTILRDIVDEYGKERVHRWVDSIAATPSRVQQVIDDLAAGEEVQ